MGSVKQLDGLAMRTVWCRMRWVVLVGLLLCVGQATANPAPLVELTERKPGSTEPLRRVWRIDEDGRFESPEARGKLTAPELQELRSVLEQTRFRMAATFNACDAIAMSHLLLVTPRGRVEWEAPCQPEPDASVTRLLKLANEAVARHTPERPGKVAAAARPLVELIERAHPGATPQRVFLLSSDGKFDYLGQQGALEEAELGVLALDLSRAVFERGPGPACDATGPSYTIKTTRGTLAWEVPCSSTPHPTVQRLVDHVQKALYEELDHPPILVELIRGEAGARRVEVTLEHSGVWHRGDDHGVLAAADRAEVLRLASEKRFAPAATCPGSRELWTWPRRACAVPGDALVTLVEKLTAKGQPMLVSLERAVDKGAFIPRILVFTNGQYFANEVTGQLSPSELAAWKKQVAGARLQLVGSTGGSGRCVQQPSTYRLRTARGKVDHRSCESPPHPTVQRLEEQLQKLRERNPQRLRLLRVLIPPQRDELVLEDGTLIGEGVRKRIDPSNASSLAGQIMGTTFSATRDGDCAAPQTHHLVESAGHGHLLWSEPCETPDPSVRALEDRMTVLRK